LMGFINSTVHIGEDISLQDCGVVA
jgi:hypothetical protein